MTKFLKPAQQVKPLALLKERRVSFAILSCLAFPFDHVSTSHHLPALGYVTVCVRVERQYVIDRMHAVVAVVAGEEVILLVEDEPLLVFVLHLLQFYVISIDARLESKLLTHLVLARLV